MNSLTARGLPRKNTIKRRHEAIEQIAREAVADGVYDEF
jgi:hypothetical protein